MAIETMEPIGPVKRVVKDAPITELPKIILGGATLMYNWYNEDPFSVPAVDLVRYAMSQGVNAIDTSPYYDPSEEIYGEVLDTLKDEFPRETYFICTKVGRINLTTFDYSAKHVRFSVLRSCKRLRTDYLDLVYLHDIEFVDYAGIWEALTELRKLKDEGVIRNFGISGYPVDLLQYVSEKCVEKPEIGPLDAVLSYCNMNLQSKVLEDYREKLFENSKLKVICNGSIVGMGLLRSGGPMEAHPCSKELRECSAKAAKYAEENGRNLPDLATRYSIAKWHEKGRTVLGVSNLQELKNALEGYHEVMSNDGHLSAEEESIAAHIQDVCFGPHLNEQWESGIPHKLS